MICAGRNCRIKYYTPFECSVSPFLEEYQDQQNIRRFTALTAATIAQMGETVILRLGQYLDFHDKMNKTLLNPNQLYAFGISICNDPTDEHRPLGIQLDSNTHLPLYMNWSNCGLMTWSPTNHEDLESCCISNISDVNDWDPSNVVFRNTAASNDSRRYSHINAMFPVNLLPQKVILFVLITYCHHLNHCAWVLPPPMIIILHQMLDCSWAFVQLWLLSPIATITLIFCQWTCVIWIAIGQWCWLPT